MTSRFLNFSAAVGLMVLTVYILMIGESLLQPLVMAVVIWYLIISLSRAYQGLGRFGVPIPYTVALIFGLLTVGLGLYLLIVLINSSVNQVINAAPEYQQRFEVLIKQGAALAGVTDDKPLDALIKDINVRTLFQRTFTAVTTAASDVGLIVIYVLFLLIETRTFQRKMDAMAAGEVRRQNLRRIVSEISDDINTYVRIKSVLSLITAGLCYIVMKIAGLDFAEFWAVIIFIMNYIPTIGWVIGAVFPIALSIVAFTGVAATVVVTSLLVVIPVFINNVIEPRLMGQSLNLSSLVILLSLAFWGYVWGVLGMFLCVPIMVIINIVLAKFPHTRPVAIMLSANGRVNPALSGSVERDET
jgi:AI-2 transport protein TqsA